MKKIIAFSSIGNIVEYYDFALYGYLSPIISANFFPTTQKNHSILLTLSVYAIGFLARPLGGIILGHLGDKIGRKFALSLSITLMGISCFGIATLPTYSQIGVIAPITLIILRFIQGLCMGGEYSGSIVYGLEQAPAEKKDVIGAITGISTIIGCFLAAIVTSFLFYLNNEESTWRLPFLIGSGIAFLGVYLRKNLPETPEFLKNKPDTTSTLPFKKIIRNHKITVLYCTILFAITGITAGISTTFANIYLKTHLNLSTQFAMMIIAINMLIYIVGGFISIKVLCLCKSFSLIYLYLFGLIIICLLGSLHLYFFSLY